VGYGRELTELQKSGRELKKELESLKKAGSSRSDRAGAGQGVFHWDIFKMHIRFWAVMEGRYKRRIGGGSLLSIQFGYFSVIVWFQFPVCNPVLPLNYETSFRVRSVFICRPAVSAQAADARGF